MDAFFISLIVLFIHATTWEGMIFEKIKDYIKPEGMLYKPLYGCPICMTPWWGTLLYLLFWDPYSLEGWFWTIGVASGFSVLWVCALSLRDWAVMQTNVIEEEIEEEEKESKK